MNNSLRIKLLLNFSKNLSQIRLLSFLKNINHHRTLAAATNVAQALQIDLCTKFEDNLRSRF